MTTSRTAGLRALVPGGLLGFVDETSSRVASTGQTLGLRAGFATVRALPAPAAYRLTPEHKRVFAGLMLGMFVASISQTIVGPAMPRIVAELGGMDHYSWVATAAMLVSAIVVPIVGKLSDMFGRRRFYLAGLVIVAISTGATAFAHSYWQLLIYRGLGGIGSVMFTVSAVALIVRLAPPSIRARISSSSACAVAT